MTILTTNNQFVPDRPIEVMDTVHIFSCSILIFFFFFNFEWRKYIWKLFIVPLSTDFESSHWHNLFWCLGTVFSLQTWKIRVERFALLLQWIWFTLVIMQQFYKRARTRSRFLDKEISRNADSRFQSSDSHSPWYHSIRWKWLWVSSSESLLVCKKSDLSHLFDAVLDNVVRLIWKRKEIF